MTKSKIEEITGQKLQPLYPVCGVYFLFNKGHVVYIGKADYRATK